jgi:transposase InsO family protein
MNTDQASQFTSFDRTDRLKRAKTKISMDGKARYLDIFIERLWRSLKYECVYLHAWETGSRARAGEPVQGSGSSSYPSQTRPPLNVLQDKHRTDAACGYGRGRQPPHLFRNHHGIRDAVGCGGIHRISSCLVFGSAK